jgi:hypothetical protein
LSREQPLVDASRARDAARNLSTALEREGFAGVDPYDALASPALRRLAVTPLARRAAIQALRRSPVDVRRLLGVPRLVHTKALALLVSAFARLARAEDDARFGRLSLELAQQLADRAIDAGGGAGWGYDFDVQTRWGYYRRGEPNAVVTAFAVNALLDAVELGGPERFGELARGGVAYARSELLVEEGDEAFFAYVKGSRVPIHNASLLVASLVARAAPDETALADAAVHYSLARQRADGSWPYGDGEGLGWVDGFHTAYVLGALAVWERATGSARARSALDRGLELYLARLIDPDGAARASLDSRYPVDVHACTSAISVLSALAPYDERCLPTAGRVLTWTLENMRRRDGRFAYRRGRLLANRIAYVRWSDSHALHALASYLEAVAKPSY